MQVKIVIGTVAFMLTMVVLGFAALLEPSRLEHFALAAEGRQIETGAEIFDNNCATCHGVDGAALECYDAAGNQIACQGLPLRNQRLVCGDRPERLEDMQWAGSKHDFIYLTVAAGRGLIMPTWSVDFGGPLRNDQVENVTSFVLNYESEEFCSEPPPPNYEWPETYEAYAEVWGPGDPARGEELYSLTYGCLGCHGDVNDQSNWTMQGPWLGEINQNAPLRIPDLSTEAYIYESVLNPGAYVVEGYSDGVMPRNFANRMGLDPEMTPQDLQDIIIYLVNNGG